MDAIYARQSIDKKDSLSIEGQIEHCRRHAGGAASPGGLSGPALFLPHPGQGERPSGVLRGHQQRGITGKKGGPSSGRPF